MPDSILNARFWAPCTVSGKKEILINQNFFWVRQIKALTVWYFALDCWLKCAAQSGGSRLPGKSQWYSSSGPFFTGNAHAMDRPPVFIPDMTLVFLKIQERLIYVSGKNKTRTVTLIRSPEWESKLPMFSAQVIYQIVKEHNGCPVKPKKIWLYSIGDLRLDFTFLMWAFSLACRAVAQRAKAGALSFFAFQEIVSQLSDLYPTLYILL